MFGGKAFKLNVGAINRLDDDRAAWHLPSAQRGIAGNVSRADDGNMVRIVGKNQRAMSVNPFPFPANLHNRIILKIGAAEQVRAFFQPQSCVRFQFDAADEITPGRHDHHAAARGNAGIKRFLKCGGVFCLSVARGAIRLNIQRRARQADAAGLHNQGERNCNEANPFHGATILFVLVVSGVCGTDSGGNWSKRR